MFAKRIAALLLAVAIVSPLFTLPDAVRADAQRTGPASLPRSLSFEDGQLVHPRSGADASVGPVARERTDPLAGRYAAHFVDTDWGHLNVDVAPTDALFVSFLIKPLSTPETARIALFRHGGKTVGNLQLTADDQLWLRIGDRRIGAPVRLPFGQVSRIGLYARRGPDGTGVLAAYLAAPDAPWGAPFAQSASETLDAPITQVRIGATNRHTVNFIADDIALASERPDAAPATPTPTSPVPPDPTAPTPPVPADQSVTFRPARMPFEAPELVNPMRGLYRWMGQEYAALPQPALDAYDRYTWRDLEPSEDDYRFTKLEQDIAQAAREGRKYAFRVRALVSEHGSSVPDYLMGRMPHGWWRDHSGAKGTYVPDWNDPSFLERAQALLAALGKRYDGDPRIAWVDIGLYGNWGEWHTASFHYPSPTGAERGSTATLHRIVDMHVAAFPTTPLVMLTDNADALAYAMSLSPRIGWRRDSLGWNTGHFEKIESDPLRWNAIKDRWKTAPVITEFVNPRNQGDPAVYEKALDEVRRYHISLVSNGNTLKWPSLSAQGKDAFVALGKTAGYRLALDQLRLPQSLAPGQSFQLETTWANDGVAPIYEPWQVVVQLRKQGNDRVVWEGSSTVDLRRVLPDAPLAHTDALALAPDVATGNYELAVLVRDPRNTRAPLQLANEGRGSDGGYRLGTITVR